MSLYFWGGFMRTKEVLVLSYQESWKDDFKKIAKELKAALGDLILKIEHVGSTSVQGLSAKPIIDIDLVIAIDTDLSEVIQELAVIGYVHEGNLGIEGREAFAYSGKEHLQVHHIYVCPENSPELKRHLAFRDYLRSHPEAVLAYGEVKKKQRSYSLKILINTLPINRRLSKKYTRSWKYKCQKIVKSMILLSLVVDLLVCLQPFTLVCVAFR